MHSLGLPLRDGISCLGFPCLSDAHRFAVAVVLTVGLAEIARVLVRFHLVAARGARAARHGFGFARNAAAFNVLYRLQIMNFDVPLLESSPNGVNYIDIFAI